MRTSLQCLNQNIKCFVRLVVRCNTIDLVCNNNFGMDIINERTNERTKKCKNEHKNERSNERTNERTNKWIYKWVTALFQVFEWYRHAGQPAAGRYAVHGVHHGVHAGGGRCHGDLHSRLHRRRHPDCHRSRRHAGERGHVLAFVCMSVCSNWVSYICLPKECVVL